MSCYTVSQINQIAQDALKDRFGTEIWVLGEVHGLKKHTKTGHIYFDLVEKAHNSSDQYIAKLSCAFFRGSSARWQRILHTKGITDFDLKDGLEVKLKASVDLYIKEGRYQLIVQEVDPSYTFGAIARKRAQTIEALHTKGLMDRNKRLEIKIPPLNVGLITSIGSAAYNDFISILKSSSYSFKVTAFDAHMQGINTAQEVIEGLQILENHPLVDIIVIIRGGGARTDLFYFDDFKICQAIALCEKPIITGIGHEIDLSVADMVAHDHFVTPTAVANFLVEALEDLWNRIDLTQENLASASALLTTRHHERLTSLATSLALQAQRFTSTVFSQLHFLVYELHTKLHFCISSYDQLLVRTTNSLKTSAFLYLKHHLGILEHHSLNIRHATIVTGKKWTRTIETLQQSLKNNSTITLIRFEKHIEKLHSLVKSMRPENVLKRGYSITRGDDCQILRYAQDLTKGDVLTTTLLQGKVTSIVEDKEM